MFSNKNIKIELSLTQQEDQMETNTNTTPVGLSNIKSDDVVCVRGQAYYDHSGNQIYRKVIDLAKDLYMNAQKKTTKTRIVSEIIDSIDGRFIKLVGKGKNSTVVVCTEAFVREKVTQSLRNALSFKYSSSTTRKRKQKATKDGAFCEDIFKIVHANSVVSEKMDKIQHNICFIREFVGDDVHDDTMLRLFEKNNLNLLETIKKESSMLHQLQDLTDHHHHNTSFIISSPATITSKNNKSSLSISSMTTSMSPQFTSVQFNLLSVSYTFASLCLSRSMRYDDNSDDYFPIKSSTDYNNDDDFVFDLDGMFVAD
mmetsp:Transcript_21079/g.24215  ORF Transcript_21079/g.24215 Transcript_21079/m.24215 type:complete len:313 (-) Transcript_21079:54-992(-)